MSRFLEFTLPDVPVYVVQTGHFRSPCFFSDQDYLNYLAMLSEALNKFDVRLHAYCLLRNQVHLLMTPGDRYGILRVMQSVVKGYTQYINRHFRRSNEIWQKKYRSCLVEPGAHLLNCYCLIEKQIISSGADTLPEYYRWSSYRWHAWGNTCAIITDHESYQALGIAPGQRQHAYRERFKQPMSAELISDFRTCLTLGRPLGSDAFQSQTEQALTATRARRLSRTRFKLIKKQDD